MQGEAIFVRVDRDCANSHFGGRAHHADRDLSTIGDQQFADRRVIGACLIGHFYGSS